MICNARACALGSLLPGHHTVFSTV